MDQGLRPFRVLCALLVVATLLGGAGLVTGHGSFSAALATQGPAVQGSPEPFRLNVTTGGADELPEDLRSERVTANYTVRIDGEVVSADRFELDYLDWREVTFEHTFDRPGTHEVALDARFAVGDGQWETTRATSFPIRVVEPGTEAALRACTAAAGGDQVGRFQCHLDHRGIPGGLVSGLVAAPLVAVVLVVLVLVVGGAGALAVGDFEVPR